MTGVQGGPSPGTVSSTARMPAAAQAASTLARAAIAGSPLTGRWGAARAMFLPWLLSTVGWWTLMAFLASRPLPGAALAVALGGALWVTVLDTVLVHDAVLRRLRALGHALALRRAPGAHEAWREGVTRIVLTVLVLRHAPALVTVLVLPPDPMPVAGLWLVGLAVSLLGWIGTVVRTSVVPTAGVRVGVGWMHAAAVWGGWVLLFRPEARSALSAVPTSYGFFMAATGVVLAIAGLASALRGLRSADLVVPPAGPPRTWRTGADRPADLLIAPSMVSGPRRWRTTLAVGMIAAVIWHASVRWLQLPATALVDGVMVIAASAIGSSAVPSLWVSPRWPLMPGAPSRRDLARDLVVRTLRREGPHTMVIALLALVGLAAARPDPLATGLGLLPLLPATGLMVLAATLVAQPRWPAAGAPTLTLVAALPAPIAVLTTLSVLHGGVGGPLSPGLSALVTLGAAAVLALAVRLSRDRWARLDWHRMPARPPALTLPEVSP